ncbi:cytochrome C [Massilia violaceinigra]|uniref:Cytochrome C n=1 Tax=Massilia violaceinigra TaxID=2045208 RepID=A0A2D2DJQ4_9BURK|nr:MULTISPECIES: cytochrome c [Massilia]ATQ75201.1 cytochrome C [Massilia violaceinigra]MDQ1812617.1 cytochrome c [Massilia sp. CCM 9210]
MKKLIIALFCGAVSLSATAGGNIANGEALVKKRTCATCHGADFNKPTDPSYPRLAGQHADYLKHALVAYKRGDGPNGRNNPIMGAFVKDLSNQDMADIAAYLHSLPSDLVLKR